MITMRYGNLETLNTNRLANFTRTICLVCLAMITTIDVLRGLKLDQCKNT